MVIERILEITEEIRLLAGLATDEGHNNVQTLVQEWESGSNRFQRPGEALFGAYVDHQLVGIGGVNMDPYESTESVARVRRLYVLPSARRTGVASTLMRAIEELAVRHFDRIQLFTGSYEASEFYIRLGYSLTMSEKVSHVKRFNG